MSRLGRRVQPNKGVILSPSLTFRTFHIPAKFAPSIRNEKGERHYFFFPSSITHHHHSPQVQAKTLLESLREGTMYTLLLLTGLLFILQSAIGFEIKGNEDGQPDLPWSDINLLVITDDHSWLGGHGRKDTYLNADFGAVLSFYQRLKAYCDSSNKDLFFVMNGDWIDGTGLSLDGDISHLVPLIQKMPFDVVNTGNHELYKSEVIDHMREPGGFIDWWGHKHLSSNIGMAGTDEPLSNQFMILEGKNSRILVFGFIYYLKDPSEEVTVYDPADVTKEDWFMSALQTNDYDAILVMAHMGTDDESVAVIRNAIRDIIGDDMPLQFVCGHTHLRRYAQIDPLSTAVEAGKYLDTIGFISFPNKITVEMRPEGESSLDLFQHVFLDANVNMLKYALDGIEPFATTDGLELQEFIQRTQNRLGLYKILGCSPADYFMNRSIHENDSMWAVYRDKVVPTQLERDPSANRAILVSQASWRYDIFEGENLYDDVVAMSPFNEPVYFIGKMPCQVVLSLNETLNKQATENFYEMLPAYILAGTVEPDGDCELFSHHFELIDILQQLTLLHPGVSHIPEPTNLTSTTIWTSFMQEEWPCAGQTGVHIPWLDDHKIFDENGDTNKENLAIVISGSVIGTLLFCGLLLVCWRSFKYMWVGHETITEDEIDSFNEKREIEAEFT